MNYNIIKKNNKYIIYYHENVEFLHLNCTLEEVKEHLQDLLTENDEYKKIDIDAEITKSLKENFPIELALILYRTTHLDYLYFKLLDELAIKTEDVNQWLFDSHDKWHLTRNMKIFDILEVLKFSDPHNLTPYYFSFPFLKNRVVTNIVKNNEPFYTRRLYGIAHISLLHLKYSLDDPRMRTLLKNLNRINQIASLSHGFIWRLENEKGYTILDDNNSIMVNLSVWADIDDLLNFTYRSEHMDLFRRKNDWIQPYDKENYVLWWINRTDIPSVEIGLKRFKFLSIHGNTPFAFTFQSQFEVYDLIEYKKDAPDDPSIDENELLLLQEDKIK